MKRMLLRPFYLVGFMFFYIYEVVLANLRVAYDMITPEDKFKDGLLTVKAPVENRIQMVVLMNLITMTPGTVSVDYNEETFDFTVHFMFDDEIPDFKRKLSEIYLPFIKAVF